MELVRKCKEQPPSLNRVLAKFVHRLYEEAKQPDLFHRVVCLEALQHPFGMGAPQREEHKELVMISRHVAKGFLAAISNDPTKIVEALLCMATRGSSFKGRRAAANAEHRGRRMSSSGHEEQSDDLMIPSNWTMERTRPYLVRMIIDEEMSGDLHWLIDVPMFPGYQCS